MGSESLTGCCAHSKLPRLGFAGSMMKRHDDSRRSGRLAVAATSQPPVAATLAGGRNGRSPRLTWSGEPVTIGSSRIERMVTRRNGDSERSSWLVVTQPLHPTPPPHTHTTFRTEKQLTAPADRPVRDPAHAVAFSTRGSGRLRPQRSCIPAPQLTVTEPTAHVAGQPHSLLGRPPPRVAL